MVALCVQMLTVKYAFKFANQHTLLVGGLTSARAQCMVFVTNFLSEYD